MCKMSGRCAAYTAFWLGFVTWQSCKESTCLPAYTIVIREQAGIKLEECAGCTEPWHE